MPDVQRIFFSERGILLVANDGHGCISENIAVLLFRRSAKKSIPFDIANELVKSIDDITARDTPAKTKEEFVRWL